MLCRGRLVAMTTSTESLVLHHAAVAKSQSIATQQPAVLTELKNLERERDEAVATAEVCAMQQGSRYAPVTCGNFCTSAFHGTMQACSKTAVKLEEMAQLLQQLALEKVRTERWSEAVLQHCTGFNRTNGSGMYWFIQVKSGDEAGARQVLIERASVKEALERSASKVQHLERSRRQPACWYSWLNMFDALQWNVMVSLRIGPSSMSLYAG
jgi:hypothetical protein